MRIERAIALCLSMIDWRDPKNAALPREEYKRGLWHALQSAPAEDRALILEQLDRLAEAEHVSPAG